MNKMFNQPDEFYIGYHPAAPKVTSSFMRRSISAAVVLFLFIAGVLVTAQKQFTNTEFEYGIDTKLSGVLVRTPVPHLQISLGEVSGGDKLFQSVLLVGSGKRGLDELLKKFPAEAFVTLKGFLIYGDGKALLQVNDANDISFSESKVTNVKSKEAASRDGGHVVVEGEITDPKCYFGVMKPGEGKPHRSCAIRCISGGIPPVLKTNSSDYFLLLNENMQPLNNDVLPIVGDQVKLDGEMTVLDDWKILKIDSRKIKALSKSVKQQKQLIAMEDKMTLCGH